jgi:hypothetical protein|nr:MAG TPA_asm: Minor capsid protein [Caudoviricetes sp.]
MNYDVEAKWYAGAPQKIKDNPNKILYTVARQTLDITYKHIPMDTGKMRKSSMSAGVRGSKGDYYVGSYTSYAKKVWNYGLGTNWTTPDTFGKWYKVIYDKNSTLFLDRAIERNKLK